MTGTILNIVTVTIGSLIGVMVGNRLSRAMQDSVMTGLGCVTLVIALQYAFKTGNVLIPMLSVVTGVIAGELLGIDAAVKRFGGWLQDKTARGGDAADHSAQARVRFINGFVSASVLFCVGPMTILGSIQNGIDAADYKVLALKSALDLFASMAFASSLGIGVLFSIISVFVVQGGLTLVGMALGGVLMSSGLMNANNPLLLEMTATGGILMIGIALTLLDIKQPRVSNFLPALVIAPLLVALANALGIPIYF